jgi:predicted Na+-dependent transporter
MPSPVWPLLARALAAAFLVAMMLAMGLELGGEPRQSRAAKRRKRRLVARALALNFVFLPLGAFALTRVFRASDDDVVVIALLLLAASPGGRFAPQLGRLAGAELGLSVEITLFLAKLVSFTAPVTARLLLRTHHLEVRELPFIVQLLALQLVPYVIGRQLRRRRPALAARIARPVDAFMWSCLVVLAAVLAARVRELGVLVGARGWWPVLTFAALAPALGWLAGGRDAEARRAFALSANARNLGVAVVLASLAFADARVHAATIALWVFYLLVDFALARLFARRPRGGRVPQPLQPATEGGGS